MDAGRFSLGLPTRDRVLAREPSALLKAMPQAPSRNNLQLAVCIGGHTCHFLNPLSYSVATLCMAMAFELMKASGSTGKSFRQEPEPRLPSAAAPCTEMRVMMRVKLQSEGHLGRKIGPASTGSTSAELPCEQLRSSRNQASNNATAPGSRIAAPPCQSSEGISPRG